MGGELGVRAGGRLATGIRKHVQTLDLETARLGMRPTSPGCSGKDAVSAAFVVSARMASM